MREIPEIAGLLAEARRAGSEPGPGLSPAARSRILSEAMRPETAPMPAPLFAPWRRLALAGGLPLALAALMLGLVDRSGIVSPTRRNAAAPTVEVAKVGDRVEFKVSNGKRSHFVSRSTAPDQFESSPRTRIRDGAFADDLEDGSSLVFYRIE